MNSDNAAGGALHQLRGVLGECENGAAGFDHNCLSKIKSVWPRYGIDANCLLLARWPGSGIGVYTGKFSRARSTAAKGLRADEIPATDGRRTTLRPALRGEEPAAREPGSGGWGRDRDREI